jgi:hypothetical protein
MKRGQHLLGDGFGGNRGISSFQLASRIPARLLPGRSEAAISKTAFARSTAMRVSFCMDGLRSALVEHRLWHIDADRVGGGVHLINDPDEARGGTRTAGQGAAGCVLPLRGGSHRFAAYPRCSADLAEGSLESEASVE